MEMKAANRTVIVGNLKIQQCLPIKFDIVSWSFQINVEFDQRNDGSTEIALHSEFRRVIVKAYFRWKCKKWNELDKTKLDLIYFWNGGRCN